MDLKIPRENLSKMVFYIWKIIRLPSISREDLLYKLSFELFIYDTEEASNFIKSALDKGYLVRTQDNLYLSESLQKEYEEWQSNRMAEIKEKLNSAHKLEDIQSSSKIKSKNFNLLFKIFVDDATLTRTASILQSDIEFLEKNFKDGIISAKVKGSKKEIYLIKINLEKKSIHHNCHDFETRKSKNKKFCKHLAKLFLILNDEDKSNTYQTLKTIANQINDWIFD